MSYFVVTRTRYEVEVADLVVILNGKSAEIFRKQPGFKSLQRFHDPAQRTLINVIEWRDQAASEACMQAPEWGPLYPEWNGLLQSGKVEFVMHPCERLD